MGCGNPGVVDVFVNQRYNGYHFVNIDHDIERERVKAGETNEKSCLYLVGL